MSYFSPRHLSAAAVLTTLIASPASAFTMASVPASSPSDPEVQNVRMVCDEYGRCYHSPRYAHRYYDGPTYSYQRRYYYNEPSYGYSGPGFSFSFGRSYRHGDDWD